VNLEKSFSKMRST